MLYPFVEPERLVPAIRERIAAVAAWHRPFEYALVDAARWPETVYAAVEPARPFAQLQAALAAAFPAFPIYGRDAAFEFVPHVTIAEGAAAADPGVLADPGWRTLPRRMTASAVEVIAAGADGRWRTVWRIRFGGRAAR
jgi:2'-5' RNA ligase